MLVYQRVNGIMGIFQQAMFDLPDGNFTRGFFWKQIGPLEIFGTLLHVSGPGHFWEKTPSIPFENRLVDWWIWELRLPNKSWGLWCQPRIFILDLWKYMEIDQPSHLNRWFSHWFRVLHVLRNALKGWWTPAVAGWQTLQWHAQRGRRSSRSAPSDVCWLSPMNYGYTCRMVPPSDVCWVINPINYSYIFHKP